jgi:hypothetical protein
MRSPTIREMIASMGYCCPQLFFHLFPSTLMVALRLGVSRRAIKYAKQKARAEGCTGCAECQWVNRAVLERAVQQQRCRASGPPPTTRPASPPVESPIVVRRGAIGDPEEAD